jgi:hypothetical protein
MTNPYRWTRQLMVATAIVGVAACGSDVSSPSGSLTGAWSGPITGEASVTGSARVVLTQTGSGVAGTFTTAYADATLDRSGSTGGTLVSNVLTMTLTPGTPLACGGGVTLSGTLSATLTVAADRLTGSYSGLTCGGATGGTLDLRRE